MHALDLQQASTACRACVAQIRAAAMDQGAELDAEARAGLFVLATLVERKAHAKLLARAAVERVVEDLIGILDALDVPDADCEPWLGAPENHPTSSWGFGVLYDAAKDQIHWADGGSDDREDENEHGTELDAGEVDDCPRPRKPRQAEPTATNVLPWRARA